MAQGKRVVDTSAQQVHDYFKSKGWSSTAAWGIAGNVKQESGFASNAYNKNKLEESYGLFQYNSKGNPTAYRQFQQRYQKPLTQATALEQMEFVDWQLRNSEKGAGDALARAKTPYDAGMTFGRLFERPQVVEAVRGQNAELFASGKDVGKGGAIISERTDIGVFGRVRKAGCIVRNTIPFLDPTDCEQDLKDSGYDSGGIIPDLTADYSGIGVRIVVGLTGLALLVVGMVKLRV